MYIVRTTKLRPSVVIQTQLNLANAPSSSRKDYSERMSSEGNLEMEPIHVIYRERTINFRATATVGSVEHKIRVRFGLQNGSLEDKDGVTMVNSDPFTAGATYEFVDGIEGAAAGASPNAVTDFVTEMRDEIRNISSNLEIFVPAVINLLAGKFNLWDGSQSNNSVASESWCRSNLVTALYGANENHRVTCMESKQLIVRQTNDGSRDGGRMINTHKVIVFRKD